MPQETRQQRLRRSLPRLIGWFFGALWSQLAVSALPPPYHRAGYALAALLALIFLVRLWCYQPLNASTRPLFRAPAYLVAVAAEIVVIYAASTLLPRFGLQQQVPSAAGFIVGLHFIGLWIATRSPRFLHITTGMCIISLVSMLLPFTWHTISLRYLVLGTGNALILWLAASGSA